MTTNLPIQNQTSEDFPFNNKQDRLHGNSLNKEEHSLLIRGFGERFYRDRMGEGRFESFTISYKNSDLWIGVDKENFDPIMVDYAKEKLIVLRKLLESYIIFHPKFGTSFVPVETYKEDPKIAIDMSMAAKIAGTGPMAAVAGAFSEYIGKAIQKKFKVKEIIVENGGDIYLKLEHDLFLTIYAGDSPLSGKVGIEIPARVSPLGVCTSAGTIGPSVSFGKADAVMIASKNTALADAYATAFGNRVKNSNDITATLELAKLDKNILSAVIICEGQIGICGQFNIKPLVLKK